MKHSSQYNFHYNNMIRGKTAYSFFSPLSLHSFQGGSACCRRDALGAVVARFVAKTPLIL